MTTTIPALGTVHHVTPANGTVTFTPTDGETWTHTLIGWAIVTDDVYTDAADRLTHHTGIEPVILADESDPMPVSTYLADLRGPISYKVNLS